MAEQHPEKRMKAITFKTTESVEKALIGLSLVDEVSMSEFVHLAILELVEKRRSQARILIEALEIKLL